MRVYRKKSSMPLNILLIQSDPANARKIRDALTRYDFGAFDVEWVRCCEDGIARLKTQSMGKAYSSNNIAAVLIDFSLDDGNGNAALPAIFAAAPRMPILVICEKGEEEGAILSMRHGAQDYLLRSQLDSYHLPLTLSNMLGRAVNTASSLQKNDLAEITLNSLGDAVISTDVWCAVTYLNSVAEKLTGWAQEEATGRSIEEVLRIVDSATREPIANPMALVMRENKRAKLAPNCLLIRRDGAEVAIEDSAAPIHDRLGQVSGAVMVFYDVTAAWASSQRMAYLAQHDALTQLPNRLMFNDRLNQAMILARRHQQKLAILFVDIDRFKQVNDSLGHAIGDRLLQSVAERLLACVRGSDTVSRQGGDEFVILLSEVAHASDAGIAAEKILNSLSESHYIEEHELRITASIGVVTYSDGGEDAETLLRNADLAMYRAKSIRDNYRIFSADVPPSEVGRQSLENEMGCALQSPSPSSSASLNTLACLAVNRARPSGLFESL
jgi:diguanylate cyclase (GGDEF)-like protein/PAS domain S-box-containing protein